MKHKTCFRIVALLCIFTLTACGQPNPTQSPAPSTTENPEPSQGASYTYADTIAWDGEYDVVVVGMGMAGLTSAISAADAGANVLISEKAPEHEAGGNSRVCHQLYGTINNVDKGMEYYSAMRGDYKSTSDDVLRAYVEGMSKLDGFLVSLGADKDKITSWADCGISSYETEHPEHPGGEAFEGHTITDKIEDGALFGFMKKNVTKRAGQIDVWFESPTQHLIQDPESKTIVGVQVETSEGMLNIRANNGVVLACGGFENNAEMVETYLGVGGDFAFMGSKYNTGDGVRMAMEVGANLWHMTNYESAGVFGPKSSGSMYLFDLTRIVSQGAAICVGPDGTRFLREVEHPVDMRHGHVYLAGDWLFPAFPEYSYSIFDEAKVELFASAAPMDGFLEEALKSGVVIKADTWEELAEKTGMTFLPETIKLYNSYCENGFDEAFRRDPQTLIPFLDEGPYYASELTTHMILNTQGGPQRNENAEVIGLDGNPIPNLYSAGELGGVTAHDYQGGGNIAECLVFGQLAGKNAASDKQALPAIDKTPIVSSPKYTIGNRNDLLAQKVYDYPMGENEYMGVGSDGMGGDIVVKVTMNGDKIAAIEILEQHETKGISDPAFTAIPDAIIAAQSADVDAVSGATLTSNALISAVKDALTQVK